MLSIRRKNPLGPTATPVAPVALLIAVAVSTASAVMVDVNDNDDGNSTNQAGWVASSQSNINGITFTAVGGTSIDDRSRIGSNGGGTEADMWEDFIFISGSNLASEGLDVTVTGLAANTAYDIKLWAWDDSSNGGRIADWTGSNGGTVSTASFPDGPDPVDLDDYRTDFVAVTDGSGVLTLSGRANPGSADGTNVFINGFEYTVAASVPTHVAAFDVNLGAGPTQSQFLGIAGADNASPTDDYLGVTLTTSAGLNEYRDRAAAGSATFPDNPYYNILRDFAFENDNAQPDNGVDFNISGLESDWLYEITIFSYDRQDNNGTISQWYEGSIAPENLLQTHTNLHADEDSGYFSVLVFSNGLGEIDLVATSSSLVIFNGLIITPVPAPAALPAGLAMLALAAARRSRR